MLVCVLSVGCWSVVGRLVCKLVGVMVCWPMCWPMCIFATTRKKSLVVFADQSIRIVALVQEAKAKS